MSSTKDSVLPHIYVCGFSLRLIFDSVQRPARHWQPSCLIFVDGTNKRLFLTETFVTVQDTSVTMMMLFFLSFVNPPKKNKQTKKKPSTLTGHSIKCSITFRVNVDIQSVNHVAATHCNKT